MYEIIVTGLPAGLGSYVHWDRKLDGLLAQAIMGTQAMKGIEFGLGFEAGGLPGSEVHDEITHDGTTYTRRTNRAGGLEGGMTTGMPLIIRGIMKPIPTMLKPLKTVDIDTLEEIDTRYERSDVCALPRAVVVIENVIAPGTGQRLSGKIRRRFPRRNPPALSCTIKARSRRYYL